MPDWFRRIGYYFLAAVMVLFILCVAGGILILLVISVREWFRDWKKWRKRRKT